MTIASPKIPATLLQYITQTKVKRDLALFSGIIGQVIKDRRKVMLNPRNLDQFKYSSPSFWGGLYLKVDSSIVPPQKNVIVIIIM